MEIHNLKEPQHGTDEIHRLKEPQSLHTNLPEGALNPRQTDQLKMLQLEVGFLADQVRDVVGHLPERQIDLLIHALTGLNARILQLKPLDEQSVEGLQLIAYGENSLIGKIRGLVRRVLKKF